MLDKDPSTISKEIRKHRVEKIGQSIHVDKNHCARKYSCTKKNICGLDCCNQCKRCNKCNELCSDFVEDICFTLTRAPYVCNGCKIKYSCKRIKYYYKALPSDNAYRTLLSEARQGANLNEFELSKLDNIISPLVKNGQSISHIHKTHEFNCTRQTLYNYLRKNYFSVRNTRLMLAFLLNNKTSQEILNVFNWLENEL